jgi:hypothetical protein
MFRYTWCGYGIENVFVQVIVVTWQYAACKAGKGRFAMKKADLHSAALYPQSLEFLGFLWPKRAFSKGYAGKNKKISPRLQTRPGCKSGVCWLGLRSCGGRLIIAQIIDEISYLRKMLSLDSVILLGLALVSARRSRHAHDLAPVCRDERAAMRDDQRKNDHGADRVPSRRLNPLSASLTMPIGHLSSYLI